MFHLETRKKNTKFIVELVKNNAKKIINNDVICGYIIVYMHWVLTGIPLYFILFGKVNIKFYISCFLWLIIFVAHFYFNGCIITKIEKKIWNMSNWYGPWVLLFTPIEYFGLTITPQIANNIFLFWGFVLTLFTFNKVQNN
tara:strand:+ start:3705 stop:4127 length:423 start_codon:yes stop_codon:yes gene_type:complete